MLWNKNISKSLAGFLVLMSLTFSLDAFPAPQKHPQIFSTEIIASIPDAVQAGISFDKAHSLFVFSNSGNEYTSPFPWAYYAQYDNLNILPSSRVQNHISLELKPVLLKVALNDILEQKSNRI